MSEANITKPESNETFCIKGKEIDKVKRYDWKIQDSPGVFKEIDKTKLLIDRAYQRDAASHRITKIVSNWSWVACNVIEVAYRFGEYYVIDGQHRVLAAMKRSDIKTLPCMVFSTTCIEEEAHGFKNTNIARRQPSPIQVFKASLVEKDEEALYVKAVLDRNGISVSSSGYTKTSTKSIGTCIALSRLNREHFENTITLAAELCQNCVVHDMLLRGLYQLSVRGSVPLSDTKLRTRILGVGVKNLEHAAHKATLIYENSGDIVVAIGMLTAINYGLNHKYRYTMKIPPEYQTNVTG